MSRRRASLWDSLRENLGGSLSLYGLIWLGVCVFAVVYALDNLMYAMKSTPREITAADAASCQHNDFVRLTAALDYVNGLQFETTHGKAYTLVPVAGTGNQLIVYQEGHASDKELQIQGEQTFVGRVVGKGLTDAWDVNDTSIKLVSQFQRSGIGVPQTALVLDVGHEPHLKLWISFIGLVGAAYLGWFLFRLFSTLREHLASE